MFHVTETEGLQELVIQETDLKETFQITSWVHDNARLRMALYWRRGGLAKAIEHP